MPSDSDAYSDYFSVGLYTYAQAARIIGTHATNLRHWTDPDHGLVHRRLPADERVLTFAELMELHFIKMFRKEGVSLPTIKKTAAIAARKFGTNYPFSVKRFDTDGRTIFATMRTDEDSEELVEDLRRSQLVFGQIIKPFFRKLEYGANYEGVVRYWPLLRRGGVVLDPRRKFGAPIDNATGIATSTIDAAVRAGGGQGHKTVADWLGITLTAVKRAVAFERSLTV